MLVVVVVGSLKIAVRFFASEPSKEPLPLLQSHFYDKLENDWAVSILFVPVRTRGTTAMFMGAMPCIPTKKIAEYLISENISVKLAENIRKG